jgi:hypothetical protein
MADTAPNLAPSLAEAQVGQIVALSFGGGYLCEVERATGANLWVNGRRYNRRTGRPSSDSSWCLRTITHAEYDRLQAAERTRRLRNRLIDLAEKARRGELPDAVMEAALAAADAAYAAQEHGDG